MLLFLVAMLYGCATTIPSEDQEEVDQEEVNPHDSKNSELLEGSGGAIIFNYIARMTGAGQTLSYIAGGVGAVVGVNDARSRKWKPGDDEIIHIDQPSVGTPYSYGGGCNISIACNQSRVPFGLYGYGYCDDDYSGGYATYDDLMRRAQRRAGCYDNSEYRAPHPEQRASYAPAQVVYPPNLWERPDKRQKTETKKPAGGPVVGPTVGNYTAEKMINPDCKTRNPGKDGHCLLGKAKGLEREQLACNGEVDDAVCPVGKYNPGLWAGIYTRLGNELVAKQIEMQGGKFTAK